MTSIKNLKQSRSRTGLFLISDIVILYISWIISNRIHNSFYDFWPADSIAELSFFGLASMYMLLTVSSLRPARKKNETFDELLSIGAKLSFAATFTLFLLYTASLDVAMPPKIVLASHWAFSLSGILALRILARNFWPIQSIEQPINNSLSRFDQPRITVAELIDRPIATHDQSTLQTYVSGRTVLVTGAGGSIGSVLSKQLIALNPFRLILVDVSENNLYHLENDLREQSYTGELILRIADVRDKDLMATLFEAYQPNIVLHAAAYKHVPLLERHPIEAFKNNTLATINLIEVAEAFDTEQFVFVSTDKAVAPSSVLGATKRMAEWYVQSAQTTMKRKIVRFGNVFASQGSVVPLFEKQIRAGGPVTVTHPDMERFFMSANEACSLILQTLLLDVAPIYILRMEPTIKIKWLAEQMVARLNPNPEQEVKIVFTGVRPGEKMQEVLRESDESQIDTSHPSIIGINGPARFSRTEIEAHVHELNLMSRKNQAERLRKTLFLDPMALAKSSKSYS